MRVKDEGQLSKTQHKKMLNETIFEQDLLK